MSVSRRTNFKSFKFNLRRSLLIFSPQLSLASAAPYTNNLIIGDSTVLKWVPSSSGPTPPAPKPTPNTTADSESGSESDLMIGGPPIVPLNRPNEWLYGLYFDESLLQSDRDHPLNGVIWNPVKNGCPDNENDETIPDFDNDLDFKDVIVHLHYYPGESEGCNWKKQMKYLNGLKTVPKKDSDSTPNTNTVSVMAPKFKAIIWTDFSFNTEDYNISTTLSNSQSVSESDSDLPTVSSLQSIITGVPDKGSTLEERNRRFDKMIKDFKSSITMNSLRQFLGIDQASESSEVVKVPTSPGPKTSEQYRRRNLKESEFSLFSNNKSSDDNPIDKKINPLPKDMYEFFLSKKTYNPLNISTLILFKQHESSPLDYGRLPFIHPDYDKDDDKKFLTDVNIQLWRYRRLSIFEDPTGLILILMACFTVGCAARFAAYRPAPERAGQSNSNTTSGSSNSNSSLQAQIASSNAALARAQTFTLGHIVTFFIGASIILTILFFTIHYLFWILVLFYCFVAAESSSQIFSVYVWNWCRCTRFCLASRHTRPRLYKIVGRVRMSDVFAWMPGVVSSLFFLYYHGTNKQWIPQDVLGWLVCCAIQLQLRIPSLRVGVVFLILMFFFDIFWVFYSSKIFGKSVMVEVSTGGGSNHELPMLFEISSYWDDLRAKSLLGLGDVALPGFLITYNLHCDRRLQTSSGSTQAVKSTRAFRYSLFTYLIGLSLAMLALHEYHQGQPALLYVVPCVLIGTFLGARKQFWKVWNGRALDELPEVLRQYNGGIDGIGGSGNCSEGGGNRVLLEDTV